MATDEAFGGMNLNKARKLWLHIGGDVGNKPATGEEVYRHFKYAKPITVNRRKKSAPRVLTNALRRLMA